MLLMISHSIRSFSICLEYHIDYVLLFQGARVEQVGSWSNPWKVNVTIIASSNPDGVLHGDTTVDFLLGWANFTDLAITHEGDYTLKFEISSPADAVGSFGSHTMDVTIERKVLEVRVAEQPTEVYLDANFTIDIDLVDAITGNRLDEIDFKVSIHFTFGLSIFLTEMNIIPVSWLWFE